MRELDGISRSLGRLEAGQEQILERLDRIDRRDEGREGRLRKLEGATARTGGMAVIVSAVVGFLVTFVREHWR